MWRYAMLWICLYAGDNVQTLICQEIIKDFKWILRKKSLSFNFKYLFKSQNKLNKNKEFFKSFPTPIYLWNLKFYAQSYDTNNFQSGFSPETTRCSEFETHCSETLVAAKSWFLKYPRFGLIAARTRVPEVRIMIFFTNFLPRIHILNLKLILAFYLNWGSILTFGSTKNLVYKGLATTLVLIPSLFCTALT